jgi:hypothetical protein
MTTQALKLFGKTKGGEMFCIHPPHNNYSPANKDHFLKADASVLDVG